MCMKISDALKDKIKITADRHFKSAPPRVEVLPKTEICEDCLDTVVDRHIDYRKTKDGWAVKCRTCQLYKNPETGDFDMTGQEFRNYWKENKKAK
jgi:nuclear transport factor 2 (NTF2) superfamily protein